MKRKTISVMMLVVGAFCAGADRAEDGTREHPYFVTTEQIVKAFDDNGVAADRKFKGAFLVISDRVAEIKKSFLGYPRVTVSSAGDKDGNYTFCTFVKTEEEMNSAAALRKGDRVEIFGKFESFTMKIPSLKSCQMWANIQRQDKGKD